MPKEQENSAYHVSTTDLEMLVTDKREHWRATHQSQPGKGDIKENN